MLMIRATEKNISDKILLTIFEVKEYNDALENQINQYVTEICAEDDLDYTKNELKNLFKTKKGDETWLMGATAEFFLHLYLKQTNYKQEFSYLNLEERSIKKGFDGVYSLDNEVWLLESKSGSINSNHISHKNKVLEANRGLKNMISGTEYVDTGKKERNNPWKNAYNHACRVNSSESIKSFINKYKVDFAKDKFYQSEDFNTMPCGTIFLNDVWQNQNESSIIKDITDSANTLAGTSIHVFCVTINSFKIFLKYLGIDYGN